MPWIVPLILLIVFEGMADILSKEWSLHGKPFRWIAALGAYGLANVFWLIALKNGSGLTRGAIAFSVGSAVLAVGIGMLLYRESVTKTEMIGVVFGIIALVLISWHE